MDAYKHAERAAKVTKRAGQRFAEDRCPMLAAAIAYYGVFALPPLLVIVVAVAGALFGEAAVEGRITGHASRVLGERTSAMVENVLERAAVDPGVGLASLLAIAGLIFGATNAFAHLQVALNIVWGVEPDRSMWRTLLRKRLLSFLMILVLVCLMVGLIAIGAFLSFLESSPIGVTLGPVAGVVFQGLHFVVTLALLTVFFAAVYAILPDVEVHWRRIWLSSAGAALLFALAMAALWLFLGFSRPGSAYGAAGNVAVVMLWIYLSTAILLFGAELTSVTYKSSASGER